MAYSVEERFRIRTHVIEARKTGMKWKDVHEIAKSAGFRGGVPALPFFNKQATPLALSSKPRKVRPDLAVAVAATNTYDELQGATA